MQFKIDEAVKLLDQYAWAVWFVTGIVLFAPAEWLAQLGMGTLVAQIRPYIGAFFLVATVLVLGRYGKIGRDWVMREVTRRKQLAQLQGRLHRLTAAEQEVLQPFIRDLTHTRHLNTDDGVVAGLEHEQVIYKAVSAYRVGLPCDYNMQPWAYSYLCGHPKLVGLDPHPIGDSQTA